MEFDRNLVFTAVNADELKPGDKVLTSNNIASLKEAVRLDVEPSVIGTIWEEMYDKRFRCKSADTIYDAELAYLVERKENCTNCGEGRWDAEHKKILCDPVNCGNGNVVFRNHEITVCEYWKPITKQKVERHTDYSHCEEAKKAYYCAMTNACPEKHYRPFKDIDELIKVWCEKAKATPPVLDKPYIWVRSKFNKDHKGCLITNFFGKYVLMNNQQCFLSRLFDEYIFLDGSPCGVEE